MREKEEKERDRHQKAIEKLNNKIAVIAKDIAKWTKVSFMSFIVIIF